MSQLLTPGGALQDRLLSGARGGTPYHTSRPGAPPAADMDKAADMDTGAMGVFSVPAVPRIGRHQEPRPFHKAAPGYDMKTLRRQLDAMGAELHERYALQAALYGQNEQLWAYAEGLLRLNQVYGEQTGAQLAQLHSRFQLLQDQRAEICLKMIDAQVRPPPPTPRRAADPTHSGLPGSIPRASGPARGGRGPVRGA